MVDIKRVLEEQGWKLERESGTAFFFNFAPWIAPKAYLHIVFREADPSALNEVADPMRLPQSWQHTLSIQNGAILYSGAMKIYGVHASGSLLNRSDVFERLPFSIVGENRSWPMQDRERYVIIGSYDYDGSRVVMDRQDESILAVPRRAETVLNRWSDADSWIVEEMARLAKLFDPAGKLQASAEDTLPKRVN